MKDGVTSACDQCPTLKAATNPNTPRNSMAVSHFSACISGTRP